MMDASICGVRVGRHHAFMGRAERAPPCRRLSCNATWSFTGAAGLNVDIIESYESSSP